MQQKFTELSDSQWQVIEKYVSHHRPRKHSLRKMVDAVLWLTRTGCQWRNLDDRYGKWESVYYYFRLWRDRGILTTILEELVQTERIRQKRSPHPTAVAVDSQSVRIGALIGHEVGLDAGKKVNGRKRHLLVDTLGLPLAIHVSAASESDAEGGNALLVQLNQRDIGVRLIRGDQSYAGRFRQAAGWFDIRVEVASRPYVQKGDNKKFIPHKGRWQVERSFAWMNVFRRLSRDYEKLPASSVAFIQLMFISIILARWD
jgi:putative transposase